MKEISGSELIAMVKEGKTVVCDFWASWCGPCRMLGPVMEELSEELKDKAEFVKVNVDDNQEAAAQFGIMSIPDVLIFADGKVKGHNLGYVPKAAMKSFLERNL